jgi:hypothetical protein
MTQTLDRTHPGTYTPPAIEPLGSLQGLTQGAGPGGEPIVMTTGGIPGVDFSPEAESTPAVLA